MTETVRLSPETWRSALEIVISKPHAVDKRLAGQQTIESYEGTLPTSQSEFLVDQRLVKSLEINEKSESLARQFSKSNQSNKSCEVILQKLISRNERISHYHQVVVKHKDCVQFIPLTSAEGSGMFQLELVSDSAVQSVGETERLLAASEGLSVLVRLSEDCGASQRSWVCDRLVARLLVWATTRAASGQESLRLVGLEDYCAEYSRLKHNYASHIIHNWAESSDPEKFVHEDLGIAAYILLIWRKQREGWTDGRKQTFVDIGCGNGLLVYILTMEGHSGVGYDIRRRKIWAWYPDTVRLEERTITACLDTKFPGADWLLGNHSDELTPWLPVFAALSGPDTNFWVLPCCPFNFTAKYQRKDATKTVFRDYLDWVSSIGDQIGFEVNEDRMKIPSTKRICFVGYQKNKIDDSCLKEIIKCDSTDFVPREKIERVRNCTQVNSELIRTIVTKVADWCLKEESLIEVNGIKWNQGSCLPLGNIVQKLSNDGVDLTPLKQECGGLQTLIRNHHYIFVTEKGTVRLKVPGRDMKKRSKSDKPTSRKTKPCWHFVNHPDSCPLADTDCGWIH